MAAPPPARPWPGLPADFKFGVDLIEFSKCHIAFLRTVHAAGLTQARPSAASFRRYSELWLPLVASHQAAGLALVPPADVAWLWHCHRLAPYRYASHCQREFSRTIEANPPFALQHWDGGGKDLIEPGPDDTGAAIRALWAAAYPSEPFFLRLTEPAVEKGCSSPGVLAGFDLLGSSERQATFLWQVQCPASPERGRLASCEQCCAAQVSGHRFEDEEFLAEAVANYKRFVFLKKGASREQVIVPTYQIDLMWHTHILASFAGYDADCIELTGSTLNHDDSLNDRSEDSALDVGFKLTKALWKQTYDEDYVVDGGMYRGEPPAAYFEASWGAAGLAPAGQNLHLVGRCSPPSPPPSLHLTFSQSPFTLERSCS